MANSPAARTTIAQAALSLAPPVVRGALLADDAFCADYGIERDITISFSNDLTAQRAEFLSAVRRILSGKKNVKVQDQAGVVWKLERVMRKGLPPSLHMMSEKGTYNLPDLDILAANAKIRIRSLEASAAEFKLPDEAIEGWRKVLLVRPLSDDELNDYYVDIRNTPASTAQTLAEELRAGNSKLSSLVPTTKAYYARLVGAYDGQKTTADYTLPWAAPRTAEELARVLRLSAHPGFTSQIDVAQLSRDALEEVFTTLLATGNRLSQVGAIEVALRHIASRDYLIEPTKALIAKVVADDPLAKGSGFLSYSALFVLIDGELSRLRIFRSTPPFYRRLAALAQAALIQDTLNQTQVDQDSFAQWAMKTRGGPFYMQSLVDLREEPRWDPDLASAAQFKADFLSRITRAALAHQATVKQTPLYDIILGDAHESVMSNIEPFIAFLPGPIEGTGPALQPLPPEFAKIIQEQIASPNLGAKSFIALVNSARMYQLDSDHAALAAKALKMGSYRLSNVQDLDQLRAILHGLATVAAVTRSPQLADEVRTLLRYYRRDPQYKVKLDEALRYGVIAAAGRSDRRAWAEFIGEWAAELSFSEMSEEEGEELEANIRRLSDADDSLKIACGRAAASLSAFMRKA